MSKRKKKYIDVTTVKQTKTTIAAIFRKNTRMPVILTAALTLGVVLLSLLGFTAGGFRRRCINAVITLASSRLLFTRSKQTRDTARNWLKSWKLHEWAVLVCINYDNYRAATLISHNTVLLCQDLPIILLRLRFTYAYIHTYIHTSGGSFSKRISDFSTLNTPLASTEKCTFTPCDDVRNPKHLRVIV